MTLSERNKVPLHGKSIVDGQHRHVKKLADKANLQDQGQGKLAFRVEKISYL